MPNVLRHPSKVATTAAALAMLVLVAATVALLLASPGSSASASVVRAPTPPATVVATLIRGPVGRPCAGHLRQLLQRRSARLSQREGRLRPGQRR